MEEIKQLNDRLFLMLDEILEHIKDNESRLPQFEVNRIEEKCKIAMETVIKINEELDHKAEC